MLGRVRGWRSRFRHEDDGVSLVEMLVAMSVLLVVLTATAGTLIQTLDLTTSSHRRVIASNVASQELDRMRSSTFAELQGLVGTPVTDPIPVVVENTDFTVTRSVRWATLEVDGRSCDAPDSGGGPTHLQATVEIAWEGPANRSGPVSAQTIVSPRVGDLDPTQGHLGVVVIDRSDPAEPVEGKRVAIQHTSGAVRWEDTDEFGCAFFAFITPGDWSVDIQEANPELWRSRPELPRTVTVGGGEVQKLTVEYDRAGTLALRLAPEDGASRSVPDGLVVTVEHTNPTTRVPHPWVAAGAPDRAEIGVFARTDYSAWLGEAIALDTDCLPSSVRSDTVRVDPAETVSIDVPAAALNVQARGPAEAGPRNGVSVTARRPAGHPCGDELVLDLGLTAGFGSPAAPNNGWVLAAMPFGVWEITGEYNNQPYTTATVTLVPGEPLVTTVQIQQTSGS